MAQTSIAAPATRFKGMVHTGGPFPNTIISRLATEAIAYGLGVCTTDPTAAASLTLGSQTCEIPNAAGDVIPPVFLGIAIADTSREATAAGAVTWDDEDSVSIMTRGQIWVECESTITSLANPVCCAHDTGLWDDAVAGNYAAVPGLSWVAYELVGSTYWGLVEVNLSNVSDLLARIVVLESV